MASTKNQKRDSIMSTITISHYSLEKIYYHIQQTCDILNDKFETSEIHIPFYSFDSFLDYFIDCQESSEDDVKIVLATNKHRISCYIKAISSSKASINYTSLNLTRAAIVKSYSTYIDINSDSNYTIEMNLSDNISSTRKSSYEPNSSHDGQIKDVEREFNNSAVIGTVSEIVTKIKEHRYFNADNKNIYNLFDFLSFLVRTYNVRGTTRTIMTPIYAGYPELAAGDTLTHKSEIYNILSFIANDIDPDKIFKSALKDHFNGLCIGPIANTDTLVVGEGLLNTAITHYGLHIKGIKTTGITLNGSTGFSKLVAALSVCGVKNSKYKKIFIVPDNDATNDANDGMKVAQTHAKKLLKLGYDVAIFDAYVGATAATAPHIKCDVFDAFSELGLDKFSSLLRNNFDFCNSITEFNIKQKTKGFSKKHISAIDKLLETNKGKYINWSKNKAVLEVAKSPLFGNINALHRAICLHLNISYNTHKEIFTKPKVALDTVEYVNGRPTIDTKKEMFFGVDNTPILLKAPMGAGKTEHVIRPFFEQTDRNSLVVLPNIALTKQIVTHFRDLNVKHYKDSDGDIKGRVVTTIDSMARFNSGECTRSLMLDEVQQIISLFCTEDRLPNKIALIEQIKNSIEGGSQFVGTSADVDDSTLVFFEKLFKVTPKIAIYGTRIEDNPNKDIEANFYKKIDDFKAAQLAITDNKEKILYVTDSLKDAEKAKAFYTLRGYTTKVISSKTKDHTIYNPNGIDSEYDVIIVTPSASVGVSFTMNTRTVFAYYTGTIDTDSFVQLISRARKRNSIHVYERLLCDIERSNKLKKQSAGADYTANNARLHGTALDLLIARSEFKAINDLTILEALINQGYKPEYTTSFDEYKQQVKKINRLIKSQQISDQLEELETYNNHVKDLSDKQVEDILTDKGKERANDEKKTAALLRKYDSLNLDGINALNDKWFSNINVVAMELDDNDTIANILTEKQVSSKAVICENDYHEISRILKEIKGLQKDGRTMITDYEPIIEKHFESVDIFTSFHSKVLNYLGVNVTFMYGALNYDDFKKSAINKVIVSLLNKFGYTVYKGDVFETYPEIRTKSVQIEYKSILKGFNADEVYAAFTEDDPEDYDLDVVLDQVTF